MNEQELIKEFEENGIYCLNVFGNEVKSIPVKRAIDLIKQLDEPQPVKVPQCVAEKIEYFKKTGDWDLFQAMDYSLGKKEIREWLEDKNNQETFARAWLDGYEVEKEKRYRVRFKGLDKDLEYLNFKHGHVWVFSDNIENEEYRTAHTRKELEEAGFGWVFDCEGVEIEEVE